MQLLPMASSPDGLISARYAVITKTPGWEVLTTTRNVKGGGGRGCKRHRGVRRAGGLWRFSPEKQSTRLLHSTTGLTASKWVLEC